MAHITLTGVLLDPTGEFSVGDKVRFTHKSTTGETIKTATSELTIGPTGAYSVNLEYGLVLVEYNDVRRRQYQNLGVATVNASNPATSIPELLNALVPVSSAELIEFQTILADCVTAKDAAVVAKDEAEAAAATLDLIANLSQAYIFDTVADMSASAIVFPDGKMIQVNNGVQSRDRAQAEFIIRLPSHTPILGDILLNTGYYAEVHRPSDSVITRCSMINKIKSSSSLIKKYYKASGGEFFVGYIFGGHPNQPRQTSGSYSTVIEWMFKRDSDGLYLIKKATSGFVETLEVIQPEITSNGTFITSSSPNSFTATIGDKFSGLFSGTDFIFKHFADNRGGIWKFTLSNGLSKTISTFRSPNEIASVTVFDNLVYSNYTFEAEFMGDDPLNAPSGGTSRGWLYYTPGNASEQPISRFDIVGVSAIGAVNISSDQSINDFAIKARLSGTADAYNWVPEHSSIGSATNITSEIFVDGEIASSASIVNSVPLKEVREVVINSVFNAENPATATTALWRHYISHTINSNGVRINNRLVFQANTDVEIGYLALLGADVTKLDRISYNNNTEVPTSIVNHSELFNSTSSVALTGAFDSSLGIYHGIGIDADANSSGQINTPWQANYLNLKTFRNDSVNKIYWRFGEFLTIPAGTIITSTATHYAASNINGHLAI